MFDRPDSGEFAVLVHIDFFAEKEREDVQEFKELVSSAGVEALKIVMGSRDKPDSRYFVGKGKLEEIQHTLLSWSRRQLTPLGKVAVIKTLCLSKIVHLLMNLPDPPQKFLRELDECFYKFLWDGKKGKIKKSVVSLAYEQGGIKMVDVHFFVVNLKVGWLRRVLDGEQVLRELVSCCSPEILHLGQYGSEFCNVVLNRCYNQFWKDVVKHYMNHLQKLLTTIYTHPMVALFCSFVLYCSVLLFYHLSFC